MDFILFLISIIQFFRQYDYLILQLEYLPNYLTLTVIRIDLFIFLLNHLIFFHIIL